MNESMFLKRPTVDETDDDLMKMQEDWEAANGKSSKPAVEIHRMKKRKTDDGEKDKANDSSFKPSRDLQSHAGRFTIDLEDIREDNDAQGVLFGIQERNQNWLKEDKSSEILKAGFSSAFSKDDGFPEPLDLSAYYLASSSTRRIAPPGKSFFAAEFDRIHGNLDDNLDESAATKDEGPSEVQSKSDDFETENEKYLASLDMEKIQEMRSEIEQRLDPKMLEFLANRRKKIEEGKESTKEKPKVSKFKSRRLAEKADNSKPKPEVVDDVEMTESTSIGAQKALASAQDKNEKEEDEKRQKILIDDMLNELEVLDEFKNREDREKYDRLATDAIQLDLTAKFGRNVVTRQQKNALKLFESCKFLPQGYKGDDKLLETARSSIDEIKNLYLEEIDLGGHRSFEFAKGLNPILDGCWTLIPARRVLDAAEKRQGKVIADDVEIVKLALLWTVLLFEERKSAFFAFAQPNDIYVHISEIFLIGSEILDDDVVVECLERVLDKYVMKSAAEGRLSIRMNAKVAGLDAFMPFYENLLKNYDQYSMGNVQFAKSILIGAYLNAPIGDSIEYRFALWTPRRNIVRQMTITVANAKSLLELIKKQSIEMESVLDEQHYVQYVSLLGAYVAAIRDDVITRDRNELLWSISTFELGRFVERHGKKMDSSQDPEKRKQYELLVDIIRKSIGDKLAL